MLKSLKTKILISVGIKNFTIFNGIQRLNSQRISGQFSVSVTWIQVLVSLYRKQQADMQPKKDINMKTSFVSVSIISKFVGLFLNETDFRMVSSS